MLQINAFRFNLLFIKESWG